MHEDLLAQAVTLATIDPKKPKQANLRRAISAAYYALISLSRSRGHVCQLGNAACAGAISPRARSGLRAQRNERGSCASFGGGKLKDAIQKGLPLNATGNYAIPKPIQVLALTFAELQ